MKDKRQQKLARHFDILCNGKKVKILNFKLKETDGKLVLELITKLSNILLSQKNIYFEIYNKNQSIQLYCTWISEFHQTNLKRYYYKVCNTEDLRISDTSILIS